MIRDLDLQVVAIAGKNAGCAKLTMGQALGAAPHVLGRGGYAGTCAADVLLTKAGPGTSPDGRVRARDPLRYISGQRQEISTS